MRIAYVSLDDVNRFMLQVWARRQHICVSCPTAKGLQTPAIAADALIIDLDYLPDPLRGSWVAHVLSAAGCGPVLVHGYNISRAEGTALRRRGVRVCRRLCRRSVSRWIAELRRVERIARWCISTSTDRGATNVARNSAAGALNPA